MPRDVCSRPPNQSLKCIIEIKRETCYFNVHSEDNPPGYIPSDIAMHFMNSTMISPEPLIPQNNTLISRFYLTGA